MKPTQQVRSGRRDCYISAVALVGAFVAWNLWFVAGGWHRQGHLGESILWGISVVVGLWSAFDAIRFDRGRSAVTVLAALLSCFHILAFLLLATFMSIHLRGQMPRP